MSKFSKLSLKLIQYVVLLGFVLTTLTNLKTFALTNPQSGAVGLQGTIPSPPPSVGATIAVPSNGQTFTTEPITVSGLCPSNLLIRLFDNGVFIGSAQCASGSYSITASLFNGQNQLIAIDYDALNQAGPNSNTVTVTYNNPNVGAGPGITLTSSYARLGADPGQTLNWPIIISGGSPPYALSIDWGDGTAQDLMSQADAATFDISHTYSNAGVYKVLIKATDTVGNVAYLQLVGVANGQINQSTATTKPTTPKSSSKLSTALIWALFAIAVALPAASFWFGKQHEVHSIRKRLSSGNDPFK